MLLKVEDIADFRRSQEDIAGHEGAVTALARVAGKDIDGRLAVKAEGHVVFRLGHDLSHALGHRADIPEDIRPDLFEEGILRPPADAVIAVEPALGRDGKAGGLQALLRRHEEARVHLTRAGAALDGVAGAAAVEGNGSGLRQREAAVRLQQDRAPGKLLSEHLQMLSFIIKKSHHPQSFPQISAARLQISALRGRIHFSSHEGCTAALY